MFNIAKLLWLQFWRILTMPIRENLIKKCDKVPYKKNIRLWTMFCGGRIFHKKIIHFSLLKCKQCIVDSPPPPFNFLRKLQRELFCSVKCFKVILNHLLNQFLLFYGHDVKFSLFWMFWKNSFNFSLNLKHVYVFLISKNLHHRPKFIILIFIIIR